MHPPPPPPPPPQLSSSLIILIPIPFSSGFQKQAKMMKGVVVAVLVAIAMVHFMAEPATAVTCADVNKALAPCVSYLTGGGTPSAACCSGVRTLKSLTPNTADRQTACQCAKDAASRNPNIREDAAAALPSKCGVQTNIPISRNTDCSSVS